MKEKLTTVRWRLTETRVVVPRTDGGRGYRLAYAGYKRRHPLFPIDNTSECVPVVDLTGVTDGCPAELAELVETEVKYGDSRAILCWYAMSSVEQVLQFEFRECIEENLIAPSGWVFSTQKGVGYLGRLPPRLERSFPTLLGNRLLTYATFAESAPGLSAKALGQIAKGFAELHMLIPGGYATKAELRKLRLPLAHKRSRPKLWESLPALAASLRERDVREAMNQYILGLPVAP